MAFDIKELINDFGYEVCIIYAIWVNTFNVLLPTSKLEQSLFVNFNINEYNYTMLMDYIIGELFKNKYKIYRDLGSECPNKEDLIRYVIDGICKNDENIIYTIKNILNTVLIKNII